MSARKFDRNVPRSVQHAVRAALEMVDDTGEVTGGMHALQAALGHDSPSATREAVAQAEAWGFMRRTGPIGHGTRRLFVVVARLKDGACATPGCERLPTTSGRCRLCSSVERADRTWRSRVIEMGVAGMSPPLIAAHVQRPTFPDVVAVLLGEGLLGSEWAERMREATSRKTDTTRIERVRRFRERRRAAATVT